MPREFRAYLLDSNNRIVKAHDLLAEHEGEATDAATDLAKDGDVEVREGEPAGRSYTEGELKTTRLSSGHSATLANFVRNLRSQPLPRAM